MKQIIQHEIYGEIIYEESFWTGKKSLSIGSVVLEKKSKKVFAMQDGTLVTVCGGFLQGATLKIKDDTVRIISKLKWYEVVLCIFPFALTLIWGNVPALVAIVPLVGGAIGGFIGGLFSALSFCCMRMIKPVWLKIIIAVICLGVTFGICCGIGYAILGALT